MGKNGIPEFLAQIFNETRTQLPLRNDAISPEEIQTLHLEVAAYAHTRIEEAINELYFHLALYIIETNKITTLPGLADYSPDPSLPEIQRSSGLIKLLKDIVIPDLHSIPVEQIREYLMDNLPGIISASLMSEDTFRDFDLVRHIDEIRQGHDIIESITNPTPEKLRNTITCLVRRANDLDEIITVIDASKDPAAIYDLEETSTTLRRFAERLRAEADYLEKTGL